MAQVVLKDLNKKYDEVHAVKDVNLTIRDKEFMVFVGPSGCGKTTTLRMVAGLEEITSGEISIGDRVVNDLPPKDRDIAMVFQNYALYPHMSVYDNMAFGLKMRKFPKPEIAKRVQDAAEILGIQELLKRKPRQLSGGQRQRVAVGRAIVRHPQVFLFDEPLSNLDAKLRVQMRVELKRLHERLETTAIYVTHDQVEAMTLGSRVVVMKDGWVQQVGEPHGDLQPAAEQVRGRLHRLTGHELRPGHADRGRAARSTPRPSGLKIKVPADRARAPGRLQGPARHPRHPARRTCAWARPASSRTGLRRRGRRRRAAGLRDPPRRDGGRPVGGGPRRADRSRRGLTRRSAWRSSPSASHFFDAKTEAVIK